MNDLHLQKIDLNLLRVLAVLQEEKSVTRAGTRLGLTQSAVSHALRRLREIFRDPLFVRDANGMRPTARASEIARGVRAALDQLQAAMTERFDPATTDRSFTVIAGGYFCSTLMPGVVERMRKEAPSAQLRLRGYVGNLSDRLNFGEVDIVIGSSGIVPQSFSYRQLMEERLAWVVREGHPLTRGHLTVERLASVPHVAIDNPQDVGEERAVPGELPLGRSGIWFDRGAFEAELSRRGLVQKIGVVVPDTYSALAIVRRSDMAALLPRRMVVTRTQGEPVKLLEPPYVHSPIGLGAHFRADRTQDPAFAWFLDLLSEEAGER